MADLRTDGRVQMSQGRSVMREHVQPGGGGGAIELLWSIDGPITAGLSNQYTMPRPGTFSVFIAHLAKAGTTASTLQMRKNGVAEGNILTVPAGVTDVTIDPEAVYDTGDLWTCVLLTAGIGAEDLQTQAYAV